MPPSDASSYGDDTAVMRMFRLRNQQRTGALQGEDATQFDALSKWGTQNLGVAAPAMPGKPVESSEPAVPAGDRLSAMAPPLAGSTPTGQTEQMRTRAAPMGPGNGLLQRRSIPALDALTEAPKKRNRGLVHRRDIGKVM